MNYLEISTSIGCPNRCKYCPQELLISKYSKRSQIYQMSFSTFKKCIDKVPKNVSIIFAGMAEPWVNPQCTQMILYAYKTGHHVSVFSSLVGLKESNIKILKKVSYHSIYGKFVVHLPSIDKYENIIVNNHYLNVLSSVIKNIKEVSFIVISSEDTHPKVKKLVKNYKIIHINAQSRANNLKMQNVDTINRKGGFLYCERNLRINMLLPNGDVILCCQDYSLKHTLGNLLHDSYAGLFQSAEFEKIRKGLEDKSLDILCRNCFYAHQVPWTLRLRMRQLMYPIKNFFRTRTIN